MAADQDLGAFREYLDNNELQLAADVLAELGTEHGNRPRPFWEALGYAYDNMGLPKRAVLCRFPNLRSRERLRRSTAQAARHGGGRAEVTVQPLGKLDHSDQLRIRDRRGREDVIYVRRWILSTA
jgi:hypothetical protein